MAKEQLILVVDDDPHIIDVVRFALEKAGFRTAAATDGCSGLDLFRRVNPDLVILDIMMPEMEGTEVCRAIRATSRTPVIFLSSQDEEVDRIVGLELGGDDYVTKPFSPRELVARVRAVLRRTLSTGNGAEDALPVKKLGRLKLDPDRYQVFWDDREVILTATEFAILKNLLGYPGKVFSRDDIISGACGADTYISDRTIDSHIRRIRRKFAEVGGDPIETVHGVGYRLGPCIR